MSALGRHGQRVDLQHGGVEVPEGPVGAAEYPAGLGELRRIQTQREGDLPRLELQESGGGLDRRAHQCFRPGGRQILDLHATLGGGDDAHPLDAAIQHDAEVQLAGDVGGLLDVHPVDQLATRSGLLGDQPPAEHAVRDVLDGTVGMAHFHPAGCAAAAGMYLGLDHPRRPADLGAPVGRLLGVVSQPAAGDGYPEAGQDLLCLVFVNVHGQPLSGPARGGGPDRLVHRDHRLGHPFGGGVDHLAVHRGRTFTLRLGLA